MQKIITIDPDIIDITDLKFQLWKELFQYADFFLISKIEFTRFFKLIPELNTDMKLYDNLCILKNKIGIKNLILKYGNGGVYGLSSNMDFLHIDSISVEVQDVTGAGDAFAGGFCYALDKNKSFDEYMRHGAVSASFAIEGFGVFRLRWNFWIFCTKAG